MTGDLMSFVVHSFDNVGVGSAGVVDSVLRIVVPRYEEGGGSAVCFQDIQEVGGVDIRAIIVCQSHGPGHGTVENASSSVWDLSQLGAWDAGGIAPGRRRVSIARWSVLELAVRCITESTPFAAFALRKCRYCCTGGSSASQEKNSRQRNNRSRAHKKHRQLACRTTHCLLDAAPA